MKTAFGWDEKVEAQNDGLPQLPEGVFECSRIEAGDIIHLIFNSPGGERQYGYYCEVTESTITLRWNGRSDDAAADTIQWVFLKTYRS